MVRIAFGTEYDGSDFVGWQAQREGRSVQACLEEAFSIVADHPVDVVCAGRTDAGVHATAQVIHIETGAERSMRGWLFGVNSQLPADISLDWGKPVSPDFHARHSARSRTYQYLILNRPVRNALWRDRSCWVRRELDHDAMQQAALNLVGKNDFSSFRAAPCQARSPVRDLSHIGVMRSGNLISIVVRANAFLHHMVRNIAGSLIRVGRGDESPGWMAKVLAARDRRAAGATAPAAGLYLIGVEYDEQHGLPSVPVPSGLFPNGIESGTAAEPPGEELQ